VSQRSLKINPLNKPATWDEIKARRDVIEQLPISLVEGAFDADEISLKRMELALLEFANLPTLDAQSKLTWKLADNTLLPLTQVELQSVYDRVRTALAVRSATLHGSAGALLQSGALLKDLTPLSNWGV